MTVAELDEIEERARAAYPGPWEVFKMDGKVDRYPGIEANDFSVVAFGDEDSSDVGVQGETPELALANAEFIAAARDDVPALVAEVRRLRGLLEFSVAEQRRMQAALQEKRGETP